MAKGKGKAKPTAANRMTYTKPLGSKSMPKKGKQK